MNRFLVLCARGGWARGAAAACGGGEGSGSGTTTTGGSGTIAVHIHGEEIATDGFARAPDRERGHHRRRLGDSTFSHVLVNVDKVWLSENPDKAPSHYSRGAVVAETAGPWAIHLHKARTATAAGGGVAPSRSSRRQPEQEGDAPLAAGERYAFSYATAAASMGPSS